MATYPSGHSFEGLLSTTNVTMTHSRRSAIYTHEGCFVNSVSNETINCPCHGSKFSIKDGSVVHGPANRPLAPIAIKVEGTSIFQG